MTREDYQILIERYSTPIERVKEESIKLGMTGFALMAIFMLVNLGYSSTEGIWHKVCIIYSIIQILLSTITSLRTILANKINYTAVDVALYLCVPAFGAIMMSGLIVFRSWLDESEEFAITLLGITLLVCAGFWITVAIFNRKKLQAGGFRKDSVTLLKPWKIWIWWVSAVPFIPMISLTGRKFWYNALGNIDLAQDFLGMYIMLWMCFLLIYTLFAPTALFIRLELKMKREEKKQRVIDGTTDNMIK